MSFPHDFIAVVGAALPALSAQSRLCQSWQDLQRLGQQQVTDAIAFDPHCLGVFFVCVCVFSRPHTHCSLLSFSDLPLTLSERQDFLSAAIKSYVRSYDDLSHLSLLNMFFSILSSHSLTPCHLKD